MSERNERTAPPAQASLGPILDGAGAFVAGTDTGVGKTIVTAGLTGWLHESGVDATAVKPAQTGAPEDDDAAVVAAACTDRDSGAGDHPASRCLRQFGPALAPRVAAAREDATLEYSSLLADCRAAIGTAEFAVVEGIGGLRVPLTDDAEVIDLAADLGLPAIVVARSGLGTLNHTALTVDALRDRGLDVPFVVLNEYEGETVAERTNPDELERMIDVPVATMPPFHAADPAAIVPNVRSALSASLGD